eukprot:scaffold85_cov358-Pavlova_lutheri.AAC.10
MTWVCRMFLSVLSFCKRSRSTFQFVQVRSAPPDTRLDAEVRSLALPWRGVSPSSMVDGPRVYLHPSLWFRGSRMDPVFQGRNRGDPGGVLGDVLGSGSGSYPDRRVVDSHACSTETWT